MEFYFIPTYMTLLQGENKIVEICEISSQNRSGESLHTFRFHRSNLNGKYTESDLDVIESDVNNCHIAIREVDNGVHVITSLRFFNGKLSTYASSATEYTNDLLESYFIFFVRSLMYIVNYYYIIRKEKLIHIQKDSFATLLGHENCGSNFNKSFVAIEKELVSLGVLEFLFIYTHNGLGHFALNESAFLTISNRNGSKTKEYIKLQVTFNFLL